MKRIIALLLTFLFLFACVSCKNSAGDETTAATALTEALAAVTETKKPRLNPRSHPPSPRPRR